jgi:hypothetical protein
MASSNMTPEARLDLLVKLGMQAYDGASESEGGSCSYLRDAFAKELRDRMTEAAMAWGIEADTVSVGKQTPDVPLPSYVCSGCLYGTGPVCKVCGKELV